MKLFLTVIMAFASAVALSANAENASGANCVPKAEMQAIAQHFTQFQNLANGDYCFDGSHESHLIAGLMFMRKTRFSSSMPKSPDDLFSGTFANDWYGYFIGRINDFNIPSSCPKGVGAYVYMFGNTMYVCPMLLSDNFTALDRASVMMHEARHIDGYPHITCSRGPRAGLQGACDQRIADHGSYGVTVETYAQLAKYGEDLHPALRSYSRASAIVYGDEAFENPVQMSRTPRLLLMTTQGAFHALELTAGVIRMETLGQSPALGHIAMRAQHMVLFPDDKSLPAMYVFARNEGEIAQQAGDIAIEYNSLPPAQKSEWLDVHYGAQWSARLLRSKAKVNCDPRSEATSDLTISPEVPTSFIYPEGYDRGAKTAYVLMQSGNLFELGCSDFGKPFLNRVLVRLLDQPYKRVQKIGRDVLGLTPDGRLFKIENGQSTPVQTSLDGRIHEIAPNTRSEFFDP